MTAPGLYKYLDIDGARLTLGNRCFKHAKPSTFNDTADLTIRGLFPEDDETALAVIESSFTDILVEHLQEAPSCLNEEMRQKVSILQAAFKSNPIAADVIKEAKKGLPSVYNLEHMKQRHTDFVAEINAFMQDYRILCASSRKDSDRMWQRYAQGHTGVVLKISPNVSKDSKYQLFRPVAYLQTRPTLYESARCFLKESLFGEQQVLIRNALEKIIYAKTLEWEYENEYRLAIPIRNGEDWQTLSYHPEEIAEIYLGARATDAWKAEVSALAEMVNPHIVIYEMFYNVHGNLLTRFFR